MELATQPREIAGKKVKQLREQGLIPAVFYGRGMENANLAVEKQEFDKLFKEAGESTIVNLMIGKEARPVIIHDVQKDFLTGEVVHIDFYGVRMDEEITATVPLEFTGEAPAVKEHGGILSKNITEVEVEALPGDLPHSLAVDLGGLKEIGESIYVKDIAVPEKVKVALEPETVVATVSEPKEEEEPTPEVDVSQVEVEGEEKRAEREEAASQEGGASQGQKEKKGEGDASSSAPGKKE